MSEQLSIFDPPRARHRDPETSHAAASKVGGLAARHRDLILAALTRPGNIYEIGARCGLTHVAVARRLPELHGAKPKPLAEPTEEKRDGCRVWRRT